MGDWACCWVLIGELFLPSNPDLPVAVRPSRPSQTSPVCNGLQWPCSNHNLRRRRRHHIDPLPPPLTRTSPSMPFPLFAHRP